MKNTLTDPEYIEQLADVVDPDSLWRLSMFEQLALPEKRRQQLDAGIALRRYAADVKELSDASALGRSVVYTKIPGGRRHGTIPTPARKREEVS